MPKPHPSSGKPRAPAEPALDLAMRASQERRYEEAEILAGDVLSADRGNVLAAQILAAALIAQGRAAEAIDPLRAAARRSQDAATETFLGHALKGVGQATEALEALRRACSRRPVFSPAFLELACQLSAAGRFEEAMDTLQTGLALSPDAAALKLALAGLHLQRNQRGEARRLFAQAHAAEPNRIDGLVGLARVNALDGDYAAAADGYRRALALQPGDVLLRTELAKCLLEAGAQDQGVSLLRSAANAGPIAAAHGAVALASTARGRLFLRTSRALEFVCEGRRTARQRR